MTLFLRIAWFALGPLYGQGTGNNGTSWTVTDGLAHCYLTRFTPELIVFFICDYYWLILVYKGYGIGLAFFSFWTRTGQLNLGQGGIMSVTVYDHELTPIRLQSNRRTDDINGTVWLTPIMSYYVASFFLFFLLFGLTGCWSALNQSIILELDIIYVFHFTIYSLW